MQVITNIRTFLKDEDIDKLNESNVPIIIRLIDGEVRMVQDLDLELMVNWYASQRGNWSAIQHLMMLKKCPANMSVLYVITNGKPEYYAFHYPKLPSKL